jgi:hypothetical protein
VKVAAPTPKAVWLSAGFFAFSGVLEIATSVWDTQPLAFWPIWDAFFRGAVHFALAAGLWRRIAICRSVAMVYCLAMLVTYGVVLGLALAQAPVAFPATVKLHSLIQVPSCAVLLHFLRSPLASVLFPRPLFGR